MKNSFIIFTDGSSRGNPGNGGWGSIVISEHAQGVFELGGYEEITTNNRMELMAVIEALLSIQDESGDVTINTDSAYVLNGSTKWIFGWKKNGWKTATKDDVLNKDLWQRLDMLLTKRHTTGSVTWNKVSGHAGVIGNERCDEIATSYADKEPVEIFRGTFAEYESIYGDILNMKQTTTKKTSSSSSKTAYSYVSFVDGVAYSDKTWASCEKRVKGTKGAKYKKVFSKEEEQEVIAEWTLSSLL